jgi:hypothetical protein
LTCIRAGGNFSSRTWSSIWRLRTGKRRGVILSLVRLRLAWRELEARRDQHRQRLTTFVADDDTLALYRFDEGDILHDSSGNGHDGRIIGAKWVELPGA